MPKKKHKVLVLGLPKTGTSTLAVMLRMLGYKVTGPDIAFKKGDSQYLLNRFENCDAFQDYPWCFEWKQFLDYENVKFIILKRNTESWWTSFYESYGGKELKYLSFPYFGISKVTANKSQFINYFNAHYREIETIREQHPSMFLEIQIKDFSWEELCSFLNEPIPKNIFGKPVEKPHANKKQIHNRNTFRTQLIRKIRRFFIALIGEDRWNKFIVFMRKNRFYS